MRRAWWVQFLMPVCLFCCCFDCHGAAVLIFNTSSLFTHLWPYNLHTHKKYVPEAHGEIIRRSSVRRAVLSVASLVYQGCLRTLQTYSLYSNSTHSQSTSVQLSNQSTSFIPEGRVQERHGKDTQQDMHKNSLILKKVFPSSSLKYRAMP